MKKHLRLQEVAAACGVDACLYVVDSGGANLPRQAEVFPDRDHFGRIFYNQARMSRDGIPQISLVAGSCTAGGAYVPALSDDVVIVRGNGTIFLGGPPLVKAATGEDVSAEELGGGELHTARSGVADSLAEGEAHAAALVRRTIANLGPFINDDLSSFLSSSAFSSSNQNQNFSYDPPLFDPSELRGVVPADKRTPWDARAALARVLDGSRLAEFKPRYGATLVCGFAELFGRRVGVLANNGPLFSEAALKGAHFIQLCEQRRVPILFLQNIQVSLFLF